MEQPKKIAILIDGDNAESKLIDPIIAEANKFGKITVKRIYCDWTDSHSKGWKEKLNQYAITPIQKFAYAKNKNSTDIALIIDAMDLLHAKKIDGFCIVSSDSDFTGLAHRIREEGLFIMGIGNSKTPEAFVSACEIFTYTEILSQTDVETTNGKSNEDKTIDKGGGQSVRNQTTKLDLNLIRDLKDSNIKSIDDSKIETAFQMVVDIDNGQALLSRFSEALRKTDPTFDHRNFGFSSFRKFCDALEPRFTTVNHNDGKTVSLKKNEQ
jgi:uncharacterized LabA/DUF88 family protein